MPIVLGDNQYGKAQNRLLRVVRDSARHEIRDLDVSVALRGAFADAHITGDQSRVLPTDTQKNTVFAFAREYGAGEIEDFAVALAWHFVHGSSDGSDSSATSAVQEARVEIDEYAWNRIRVGDEPHDHAFVRAGEDRRTAVVTASGDGMWVIAGVKDLALLKTTGSEFRGFARDAYTTLEEAPDRVLATSLLARWRYRAASPDWGKAHASIRRLLLQRFADTYSYALQQTLYAMGEAVLEEHPEVAEIRFSAPNNHHFRYDLSRFGMDNPGEVFHAADRPYGLIEATVTRDDAPDPGPAWHATPGFC